MAISKIPVPTLALTATDLKDWGYCARIPFYHHVMPVEHVRTYKMKRAVDAQPMLEQLENRRTLRAYGIEGGERRFGVWLHSPRLALSGRLDLLILTPEACFPVDFKDTQGGVRASHRIQLAAYAMLAEEAFGRPARRGFIYLVPLKQVVPVELEEPERSQVIRALGEIRRMALTQAMPPATRFRARCTGCEYQNYCGDIW